MLQKHLFALFFLLAYPFLAYAAPQDCKSEVKGILHDKAHAPIAGVSVHIVELNLTTITDQQGAYSFTKLCKGRYTFVFEALGYASLVQAIEVGENGVESDFALEEGVIHLDETVVSQVRPDAPQNGLSAESIKEEELARQAGKPLTELLQNIAGINSLQTGVNIQKPILHGLSGNRLPLIQGGVKLESQQWGSDHAPEIDAQGAKKITVVKGASAIRYGAEAIGGVILTDDADLPRSPSFNAYAGTSFSSNPRGMTGNLGVVMGSKRVRGMGFRLNTSGRYVGDAQAPTYTLSNTGAREFSLSSGWGIRRTRWELGASASYFRTTLGVLRSAHIGNLSDLAQALTKDTPWYAENPTFEIQNPKQFVQHSLAKADFKQFFHNGLSLQHRYGFQWNSRQEFDIRRGKYADKPALSLQLFSHSWESLLEYNGSDAWAFQFGTQLAYQSNQNDSGTGISPLIPDFESKQIGIFTTQRALFGDNSIELGLRFDAKDLLTYPDTVIAGEQARIERHFAFQAFNFSLGGVFYPTEHLAIRGNIGSAWRPPHPVELFAQGLHHGVGSIEQGNRALTPEKAIKALLSLEYRQGKTEATFSAYLNDFSNFVYLKPSSEGVRYTIRGAFPVLAYTQTQARFVGFDFQASLPLAFLRLPLAYQVQASAVWAHDTSEEARQLTPNANLIGVPPVSIKQSLEYTTGKLGFFEKTYLQTQVQWTLRQSNAPRRLSVEEIKALTNLSWQPSQTDNYDFAPAPAGYALLNIRLGGTSKHWGIHLEANNVLNTRYRSYLNRLRYYADEVGRNFTLRVQYFLR